MSIESSFLDITILKCHISNDPLFLDMQRGGCTFFCEIAIIDLKVHAGFLYNAGGTKPKSQDLQPANKRLL